MADRAHLKTLERILNDKGMLIEAGWIRLRLAAIPDNAPAVQLDEMRNAFYAGARHLLTSLMNMLDPGEMPTDADLARLSRIEAELQAFMVDFELRRFPAEGRA